MTIPTLGIALLASVLPQDPQARGEPAPDLTRLVEAEWAEDAPGQQVLRRDGKPVKFLPLRSPPYAAADEVADRVGAEDLVIGLVVDGKAFAYPINMLGGPQREIVNDQHGNVAFAVNW